MKDYYIKRKQMIDKYLRTGEEMSEEEIADQIKELKSRQREHDGYSMSDLKVWGVLQGGIEALEYLKGGERG